MIVGYSGNKRTLQIPGVFRGLTLVGIGRDAFTEDGKNAVITSVTIPDSVTFIEDRAFYRCSSLQSLILPADVRRIGNEAFSYANLTTLELPSGLETIGEKAFCYSGLSTVTIPESVSSIGRNAFRGCSEIRGKSGSAAQTHARELGVTFTPYTAYSNLKLTDRGLPVGLNVERVTICELDENRGWLRRMGNSASLSQLGAGHTYAYSIELTNESYEVITFPYKLYRNGVLWSSGEISVDPKCTVWWWVWATSGESPGAYKYKMCIGDHYEYEKTLTITK